MQATLERVATVKAVSIFSGAEDDAFAEIVTLLEEIDARAGEAIFHKGDPGTALYIVVEGRVRVHDGDRTLSFLGKQDVFGEMAALDPEPRSATVTAIADTHLFRLERDCLYRLMDSRPEVASAIIHVLCHRLRARVRELVEDYTYMQQFALVTAAASAMEAGMYEPESLDQVAKRTDDLGQLARVFQRMAREVYTREQKLKHEVEQLRIEIDEAKAAHQIAEITGSDYFKDLQSKGQRLRQARSTGVQTRAPGSAPDFAAAKRYALDRLERELPPQLTYHWLGHTRDEVAVAVDVFAAMEGVQGEELFLLRTAALYHDLGFIERSKNHEDVSIRMALTVLPDFGYSPAQIAVISNLIQATRLPQSPNTLPEMILADADLDVFGREDFLSRNDALRREVSTDNGPKTDEEWYRSQVEFMEGHTYFTLAARTLEDSRKRLNIEEMQRRLRQSQE